MNIELILSLSGIAIAVAGVIYTYTVNRKLDRQNIAINENTIAESKQANFEAWIESEQKLSANMKVTTIWRLIVKNTGKQPARNFSMTVLDGNPNDFLLKIEDGIFPMKILQPGQTISFAIALHFGSPDFLHLKFNWSDEFKENREIVYDIKAR